LNACILAHGERHLSHQFGCCVILLWGVFFFLLCLSHDHKARLIRERTRDKSKTAEELTLEALEEDAKVRDVLIRMKLTVGLFCLCKQTYDIRL
jgi:hypothetical protein